MKFSITDAFIAVLGVGLGLFTGALAQPLNFAPFTLVKIYAVFLVLLALWMWFDDLLGALIGRGLNTLLRVPNWLTPRPSKQSLRMPRYAFLLGTCVGLVVISIWHPPWLVKFLRSIHF
jgi:hypothetical protein